MFLGNSSRKYNEYLTLFRLIPLIQIYFIDELLSSIEAKSIELSAFVGGLKSLLLLLGT